MPASNKGVFGNDNSFAGCSADLLEAVESEKKEAPMETERLVGNFLRHKRKIKVARKNVTCFQKSVLMEASQ